MNILKWCSVAVLLIAVGCGSLGLVRKQRLEEERKELGFFVAGTQRSDDAQASGGLKITPELVKEFPWGLLVTALGGTAGLGGLAYGLKKSGLAKNALRALTTVAHETGDEEAAIKNASVDLPMTFAKLEKARKKANGG